ncbi:MAG: YhjD/YihY/BrkB family envelope integrity protein, partial [Flavobacteriales bacterium]
GSISILYNIGDLKDRSWKTFSAGATFTTVLFLMSSLVFSWFLESFNTYSALYSTLGNFLSLLIWLNLNSTILLLGFELNTSIKRAKLSG